MRRVLDPDAFVISSALTLYLVCWASALWFLFIPGVVVLHFARSDSSDMVGTGLMARSGVAEFPAMRRKDRLRSDDRLITPERREWLLDQLGELIGRCGSDRFIAGLPRADAAYFPDPWEPSLRGLRVLTRRLMTYAGLGHLEVETGVFGDPTPAPIVPGGVGAVSQRHQGAAAWFLGIEGETCRFGVEVRMLDDPMKLVAGLGHEVAHAFRAWHGLVQPERRREEELTDLTTIYLGFGLFTVNASYTYRASGEQIGIMARTEYSHSTLGYLSPQEMSFLLAAQISARSRRSEHGRRIQEKLETNQADWYRQARAEMDLRDLVHRLRLPEPETWPASSWSPPRPFGRREPGMPAPRRRSLPGVSTREFPCSG